jgi:hypothetical protein
MFATGYIDSVTFNGTARVYKDVLFDDGIVRQIYFYKDSTDSTYYKFNLQDGMISFSSPDIVGTGVFSYRFKIIDPNTNNMQYSTSPIAKVTCFQIIVQL